MDPVGAAVVALQPLTAAAALEASTTAQAVSHRRSAFSYPATVYNESGTTGRSEVQLRACANVREMSPEAGCRRQKPPPQPVHARAPLANTHAPPRDVS